MNRVELSMEDLVSILESAFFALGRPLSMHELSKLFHKEKIPVSQIQTALNKLSKKNQDRSCGVELKEVAGAYQLRTKEENKEYVRRLIKGRAFQLSDPALEVLSVVAYQQPCTKGDIDEVRGVESGHLLKTLIEKELVCFGGKSSQPGRPTIYKTTHQFLEIFGLKSLKDLPSLEDIKDLLPADSLSEETPKLKTVIDGFQNSDNAFQTQKVINKELETVSNKIRSIQSDIKSHSPETNTVSSYEKEN